ncbi:28S ribosomal protein S18c, mitochondrial isoform X1 [Anoplopoma fimbria]|uniref:28S ribosomal protein S18c, mitochondrial isoform X1 n=1 Tax=Anoplopoma fimbria TaxID=229290 RepID=UPI0023EB0956|nr:28S ribosomal protein S18c, mitochondrial isoform X1 [Anoplopoma fimbria]
MVSVRMLQRLRTVLSQHGLTGFRSFSAASHVQQREEALVKMENPFKEPEKGCLLCSVTVDFKNTQLLSQFISPHTGRIYGRHITGLCGRKQKEVSKAIKKAHSMGFMSVTHKHPQFMRDPNICGIKHLD